MEIRVSCIPTMTGMMSTTLGLVDNRSQVVDWLWVKAEGVEP